MTATNTTLTATGILELNDALESAQSSFLANAEAFLKSGSGKITALAWNWENVIFSGYASNFFDITLHLESGKTFFLGEQNRLDERAEMLDELFHVLDYSEADEEALIAEYNEDAEAIATNLLGELTGMDGADAVEYLQVAFAWLFRNEQRDGRVRMDLKERTEDELPVAA